MDYLEKEVHDGKQASAFVEQEAWKNAVARVRAKYFKDFSDSKLDDQATRDKVYAMNRALSDIELELKIVKDRGLHAESEVARSVRRNK